MGSEQNHLLATTAPVLQDSIYYHARYSLGQPWENLSTRDLFTAVVLAVRDRIMDRMLATEARYQAADAKRLYDLSVEFLMGQSRSNNLYNLGIFEECRRRLPPWG
jgi:starch phosphorylase